MAAGAIKLTIDAVYSELKATLHADDFDAAAPLIASMSSEDKDYLLYLAAHEGCLRVARTLYESGAKLGEPQEDDPSFIKQLHIQKNAGVASLALEMKAYSQIAPLHFAILFDDYEKAHALMLVKERSLSFLEKLILHRAVLAEAIDFESIQTIAHFSTLFDLNYFFNILTAVDAEGESLLDLASISLIWDLMSRAIVHSAIHCGHMPALRFFSKFENFFACALTIEKDGLAPLAYARDCDQREALAFLLEHGASDDATEVTVSGHKRIRDAAESAAEPPESSGTCVTL